jgi:hypothetical protein
MTRNPRTKAALEAKITDLYIRLMRRKTTKVSRKVNLKKRLEFFTSLLAEMNVEAVPTTPDSQVDTETQTSEG